MKAYRLKHVPTGLYLDYRSKHLRLTSVGKIYISGSNALNFDKYYDFIFCYTPKGYGRLLKKDFVKEDFEV